jgi:uncharacterized protein YbaP (TraB family)
MHRIDRRRMRRALAIRTALTALLCALLHGGAVARPPAAGCPPAATAPTPAQVQAGMKAARNHGFLWRIRKDGRESWLYGTLHVARFDWMFPGPAVTRALNASDTIALELDMLDPDVQRRLAEGMAASAASPLPEPMRQRLQRQAEAECVPPQALDHIDPEMQIATLESLVSRGDGLDPAYGIDIVLSGWGRGAGKAVVSLETPELQLAALKSPTLAETIESIDSTLTEMEIGRAAPALGRIAQVWADGDLDALSRYESWCDCIKTPAERAALARLLDERNPALADAIAALHARGEHVFAAVGSLHMIGPLGLPALLAQRGFRVQRILPLR